ncbi:phospholipase A2-like [Polyergus mexicanus]|uniref:phospholipase A2-like n=1 Tax=Polyergus mexicanus TaxID=615972 RepID=UPI0038B43F80
MSRICLFVLFLILSIGVRFGDCENNTIYGDDINCVKSVPGLDKTRLSSLEKIIKRLNLPIDAIDGIIKRNNRNSNILRGSFSNVFEKVKDHGIIFPGTFWCGGGDIAENESDLGRFNKTDTCCRAHDNCKNNILADDTEVNLINNGIFTRSACSCDREFYKCLKKADNIISKTIGDTYFNILQPQCFECICPIDGCQPDDDTACKNHCEKYGWFDNSKF